MNKWTEVVARRCSVKKVFLEISQTSQENTCTRVYFLIKLQPATLLKNRVWHKCFSVNFAKFLRTPFLTKHLPWLLFSETQVNFCMDRYIDLKSVPLFFECNAVFFETGMNEIVTKKKLHRRCSVKKLLLEILHYLTFLSYIILHIFTCIAVSFK